MADHNFYVEDQTRDLGAYKVGQLRLKFQRDQKGEPIIGGRITDKNDTPIGILKSVRKGGLSQGVYSPPIYTIILDKGQTLG